MAAKRAVFLDRDGVLLASPVVDGVPRPAASAEEARVLPGVVDACRTLHQAGLLLIVVTNQPDIARGVTPAATVAAVNQLLESELEVDAVLTCPHDDSDACACRKPAPGLLLQAARDWDIDLASSIMVGDRWKDIAAGQAAGCRTIFIDRDYGERRPVDADATVRELPDAVPIMLAWLGSEEGSVRCPSCIRSE